MNCPLCSFVTPSIIASLLLSQNSIRHNLSLNRAFRKVEQPEGMKKGCQWGLNPAREAFLESEMSRFLQEDDKSWEELCFKYGKTNVIVVYVILYLG